MLPAARSIGERIKQARKARGLSQVDLAQRIGVSQPAIANWGERHSRPAPVDLGEIVGCTANAAGLACRRRPVCGGK